MRALTAAFLFVATFTVHAAERLTAIGSVVDESTKQPIGNATVLVHSAGVRAGYDQFCPTCYVDCGKRATTDANGRFSIAGLSPELLFTFLVVREGYGSVFIRKHDPRKGETSASMKKRVPPDDPKQLVRGKVVDAQGTPVREALISQQGIILGQGRRFGDIDWIDLIAVSNREGEFEMAYSKPATAMILEVAPRGMAPTIATLNTGGERHTVTVREGATIRGRLVAKGKPIPEAELALGTHSRIAGTTFQDVRIGTNAKGEFAITNVPAGRVWDLFATMDSLATKGLAAPVTFVETKDDGQEVAVGDIEAKPGHTLRGRIVLSDGAPIPPDMRVSLSTDRGSDRQVQVLPPDGKFEFKGLGKGVYNLLPAVKGYEVQGVGFGIELLVQGDRENFNVTMHGVKR